MQPRRRYTAFCDSLEIFLFKNKKKNYPDLLFNSRLFVLCDLQRSLISFPEPYILILAQNSVKIHPLTGPDNHKKPFFKMGFWARAIPLNVFTCYHRVSRKRG